MRCFHVWRNDSRKFALLGQVDSVAVIHQDGCLAHLMSGASATQKKKKKHQSLPQFMLSPTSKQCLTFAGGQDQATCPTCSLKARVAGSQEVDSFQIVYLETADLRLKPLRTTLILPDSKPVLQTTELERGSVGSRFAKTSHVGK